MGPQVDARGGWTDLQTSDRELKANRELEVGDSSANSSPEIRRSCYSSKLESGLMD